MGEEGYNQFCVVDENLFNNYGNRTVIHQSQIFQTFCSKATIILQNMVTISLKKTRRTDFTVSVLELRSHVEIFFFPLSVDALISEPYIILNQLIVF